MTAGTWSAEDGASLEFPSGANITTSAGNLSLGGSGANIAGIAGLGSNSGSFSLTGGADFNTTGNFTNSGRLTVGPGSTLSVADNYTQTPAGTLNVQIGGTPASGQFGLVAITGTASLGGTLSLALVNGFAAGVGQDFPVMTFASASGTFSTVSLGRDFGETINSTSLDLNSTVANPTDLSVSDVSAPTTATAGQEITVTWQVTNTSANNASGNWQDSVYLSTTPTITANSILLGAAPHSGGLNANASYDGTFSAPVPALEPGSYYVLVEVDSLYQVSETTRANNTLAAASQLNVSLPVIQLGTPDTNGSFTAADQDQYYQVTVPAGGSLQVALASDASSGATALYISQDTLPTPYNYQEAADVANQLNQTVTVPQVSTGGIYYILAESVSGAAATAGYTLTATQTAALAVTGIGEYSGGNAGNMTIEIDGTNFLPSAAASLTGGTTINASAVDFVSASQLFATFNLTNAASGNYTLKVQQTQQGVPQSATELTPFQVVAAVTGSLNVDASIPQAVRPGRTASIVINYSNPTNNDMVAPLLNISSSTSSVSFSTPDDPNNFSPYVQVMAVASSGPAGILRPGQSGQLTVTLLSNDSVDGDQIPIRCEPDRIGPAHRLGVAESSLQPSTIPTAAWNVIYKDNLLPMVGSTTDSYNAALAQAATYLGNLGETTGRGQRCQPPLFVPDFAGQRRRSRVQR